MYYLRTKPAAQAIQFTVDKTRLAGTSSVKASATSPGKTKQEKANTEQRRAASDENKENENTEARRSKNAAALFCSLQNKEDCMMCGS